MHLSNSLIHEPFRLHGRKNLLFFDLAEFLRRAFGSEAKSEALRLPLAIVGGSLHVQRFAGCRNSGGEGGLFNEIEDRSRFYGRSSFSIVIRNRSPTFFWSSTNALSLMFSLSSIAFLWRSCCCLALFSLRLDAFRSAVFRVSFP